MPQSRYSNYKHSGLFWPFVRYRLYVILVLQITFIVVIFIIMYMMVQVKEEEKTQRQDLYVLATGYSGQLRNRLAHMMRESDFHQVRFKRIVKEINLIIRTINFVSV